MRSEIDMLALVVQTPRCLPPIVWSNPGCGKSSRISQMAGALSAHLETVISSIRDPSDFGGLPIPENGHGVRLEAPSWAHRLANYCKDGKPGLAFFDEASCAPPAVQAAMLRVLLEGVVGDLTLPPSVRFVAAANPPEQAASGWDLALPLANRFVHLVWGTPSVSQWTDWLTGQDDSTRITKLDLDAWHTQFGQAKALAAAFLRRRPGHMAENPDKITGRFPMAYATPRTWEAAVRLLATARAIDDQEIFLPLCSSCIGEPISIEFATWLRANDLPDPEALLANPKKWVPNEDEPDRVFATCLATTDAALDGETSSKKLTKKQKGERWHQAWRVLERAIPVGKDMVIVSARKLAEPKSRPEGGLIEDDVRSVIRQLKDVVAAAGIV
jgi:hypothetical protein